MKYVQLALFYIVILSHTLVTMVDAAGALTGKKEMNVLLQAVLNHFKSAQNYVLKYQYNHGDNQLYTAVWKIDTQQMGGHISPNLDELRPDYCHYRSIF